MTELYNLIAPLSLEGIPSYKKYRVAEAVHDDNTRMELRLLNSEHPELSYFDARDRVMKLMSQYGKSNKLRQNTVVQQAAADQDVQSFLKQQSQQIAAQQKQIEFPVAALSARNVLPRGGGSRRCWACDSCGHLLRTKNTEVATPAAKGETQGKNLN